MKHLLALPLAIALAACAVSYQYTRPDLSDLNTPLEVMIVCDYLGVTDDVGELWNFDEDSNREYSEHYGRLIADALLEHGYLLSQTHLSASGLGATDDAPVDHYVGAVKQQAATKLPMIWESRGLTDSEIVALQELLEELVNHVAWIPDGEMWLDEFAELDFAEFLEPLEIGDDTLIFLASMAKPKVSIAKGVGGAVLSSALTLGLTGGGYYSFPDHYAYEGTAAFLIHKGSGKLIWKNYYAKVHEKRETPDTFFAGFPPARGENNSASQLPE